MFDNEKSDARRFGGDMNITLVLHDEEVTNCPHPHKLYVQRLRTQEEKLISIPEFVIGRSERADFNIRDNKMIARVHAKIHYAHGKYYLKDVNAANGIFINGKRCPPYSKSLLADGLTVHLADEGFAFYIDSIAKRKV